MTKRIKLDVSRFTQADICKMADLVAKMEMEIEEALLCLDQELAAVRTQHEKKIIPMQNRREETVALMEAWADANKPVFEKPRTITTSLAVFGYRLGQWSVKPMKGLKFADILERLQKYRSGKKFIRVKREIDKEALIASREKLREITRGVFGINFVQDETFFIERKQDQLTPPEAP